MSFASKVKFIILIALGIIISALVYNQLTSLSEETKVLILKENVSEKNWIKPEMVEEVGVKSREKDILAPGSFSTVDELKSAIAKVDLKKGSYLKKSDVITGSKDYLIKSGVINDNDEVNKGYFTESIMRLITLKLDAEGAIGSELKSGDYVDVILTAKVDQLSVAKTIMQHIKVSNVARLDAEEASSPANVTLEVTLQQANDLALAKRNGNIDLVLNPTSGNIENVEISELKNLLSVISEAGNTPVPSPTPTDKVKKP